MTTVFQGIDPALFRPRSRNPLYPDRFVIFSGGKFEYRKAQDIVVAAFREFHARHAEALLLFAWDNQWTQVISEIAASPHVEGAPGIDGEGGIQFAPWLLRNGLAADAFVDLATVPNHDMPPYLAAADVALFPNRCEPGTNLVAMEAMATGLPAILSANTGHLDLIGDGNCLPLRAQAPATPPPSFGGAEGWGESSVAEIVEGLETVYRDRDAARQMGAKGAATLAGFSWSHQVGQLLSVIDSLNEM